MAEHRVRDRPNGGPVVAPVAGTRRRRGRRAAVGVLAAVAALALAVAGFRLLASYRTPTKEFDGRPVVPVSFRYPTNWHLANGGTTNALVSPHSTAILPLFTELGGAQNWAGVRRILHHDPWGAVGVYAVAVDGRYPPAVANQQAILRRLLPEKVTFTAARPQVALGASSAVRLDGVLSDPADSGTRLRFLCYIGGIDTGRSVYLVLFSSDDAFNRSRGAFDLIAESVKLSG
jgi:hypothetical protein